MSGVWIDARSAQDAEQGMRGIGRYVLEHTRALVSGHPEAIAGVVIEGDQPLPPRLERLGRNHRLHAFDDPSGPEPALLHIMSPFEPLWSYPRLVPPGVDLARARIVATVYDLIPKVLEVYALHGARRSRYEARLQLLSRADHLLAISQFTAEDVQRVVGVPEDRITVIDAGITGDLDTSMTVPIAEEVLGRRFPDLRRGFPLYVGGADPRKNLLALIRAWGLLEPAVRAGRPLVICGHQPPDRVAAHEATAAAAGLLPADLLQTGYVSDRELAALYRICGAFVFPSFYEGSGMPMLEAMAFGIPVVAADASTAPEVLGDSYLSFIPDDLADMARSIARALGDDRARARLRARSRRRSRLYTWDRVADLTINGYERALAAPRRGGRRGALSAL